MLYAVLMDRKEQLDIHGWVDSSFIMIETNNTFFCNNVFAPEKLSSD